VVWAHKTSVTPPLCQARKVTGRVYVFYCYRFYPFLRLRNCFHSVVVFVFHFSRFNISNLHQMYKQSIQTTRCALIVHKHTRPVTFLAWHSGGVTLVLWAQTSRLSEMMPGYASAFYMWVKWQSLIYYRANSVIIKNAISLNIRHIIYLFFVTQMKIVIIF
jgi:hypothetical protein